MAFDNDFYWKKEVDPENNLEFIILGYRNEAQPGKNLTAWIAPAMGSNMCRFSVGCQNVIDFDSDLLMKREYTGTPVLYPTPNRVRNGMFRYRGKIYNQLKRGESVFEHGLVHNEAWRYSEPVISSEGVCFNTWIDFNKESILFEAFPFTHRLLLEFSLSMDGIKVSYTIQNMGEREVPFGFGLHPFFMKLSGEDETYVTIPAYYVMDYTSDLLPTGRLIEVKNTIYDIRKGIQIGALDLDHVFTGITEGEFAEIEYRGSGIKVTLSATKDFSHIVLYSPNGKNYFCIENQTCSTDTHNLYERGFSAESGLKFVPVRQIHSGYIKYSIQNI